jgi:putative transcriptional regulator
MVNDLAARRQARGWSQAELGTLVGVSRQTINAIEKGRYDPSLPLAFKLARTFSCAIEDIFDDGERAEAGASDERTHVRV